MALWDSEGGQLIIEMVVASVAALLGLWYLKKRTKDKESAAKKSDTDQQQPPSSS
ncbi:MAG TPA: hypothetical protein VF016_02950 [Nitrososphaera sp.]|jgi:hypothetical protein|nr:hypothetical protein [uncultured Nitrososphaera sp.]